MSDQKQQKQQEVKSKPTEMTWQLFNDFLKDLEAKRPTDNKQLKEVIHASLPFIKNGSGGASLREASRQAYSIKDIDKKEGLAGLQAIYPYYQLAYPKIKV